MKKTKTNEVAIIGHGYVGRGMSKIFPDALIFDPIKESSTIQEINKCSLAIICVPTPPKGMKEQRVDDDETLFREVDLSYVEDVLSWLEVPLVLIKSTIPPGTVYYLRSKYNIHICFSPEYMGESKYFVPPRYPQPDDPRQHEFMIVGGDQKDCDAVLEYFIPRLGASKTYFKCTAVEAELIKYMENTWGAMKVTFANEWYEMCKIFGASYISVREGWALDSRVEKMHTSVFPNNRGFGGKCFPKDLLGIVAQSEKEGYEPKLLKEVWESNKRFKKL